MEGRGKGPSPQQKKILAPPLLPRPPIVNSRLPSGSGSGGQRTRKSRDSGGWKRNEGGGNEEEKLRPSYWLKFSSKFVNFCPEMHVY